jgi:hypothetical protein
LRDNSSRGAEPLAVSFEQAVVQRYRSVAVSDSSSESANFTLRNSRADTRKGNRHKQMPLAHCVPMFTP